MSKPVWAGTSNNWATAGNWSTASVPVNGDEVYIRASAQAIGSGLNQSAVLLASLEIEATQTGEIGLATTPLQIGATSWRIGSPSNSATAGGGAGRINVDFGSSAFAGLVVGSKSGSTDAGLEPVRVIGSSTSNTLTVTGGRVGVATSSPTDTAALSQFSLDGTSSVLRIAAGCTWTSGYQINGVLKLDGGGTTLVQDGGTLTTIGDKVVRTMTVGGIAYLNHRPVAQAVTSVTRSSTTATVSITAHGYGAGDSVYIAGADQADYNGFKTILVSSANAFTFAVDDGAETPATGTITSLLAMASLTVSSGGTADFSSDARTVAVAAVTMQDGAKLKRNAANPAHLVIGTLALSGASSLSAD